jgi:hypothetical protein
VLRSAIDAAQDRTRATFEPLPKIRAESERNTINPPRKCGVTQLSQKRHFTAVRQVFDSIEVPDGSTPMLLLYCLPVATGLLLLLRRTRPERHVAKAAAQEAVAADRQRTRRSGLQMRWTNTAEGLRAKWIRME